MTLSTQSAIQASFLTQLATGKLRLLWCCPVAVMCSAVVANMAIAPSALATEFPLPEESALEESVLLETVLEETALETGFREKSVLKENSPLAVLIRGEIVLDETTLNEIALEGSIPEEIAVEELVAEETVVVEIAPEVIASEKIFLEEIVSEGIVVNETALEEIAVDETVSEALFLEEIALEEMTLGEAIPDSGDLLADVGLLETDASLLQPVASDTLEMPQSLLLSQADSAADAPPKFGTAGKQRWYLQSAVGLDFDDDAFGLVGAGITHFFYDYHSLSLELNGLYFAQPGDNAAGLNLNLLLRSHWIRGDNWSIYVDGGAGILQSTDGVPSVGSTFNFTPQVGAGATFALNDDAQRLMMGMRWHHTSSANTFRPNPGLDVWLGYVGINFPL